MVDNVRFGPASPVPAHRSVAASDVKCIAPAAVAPAAPQTLSLASALAQKGPPYDADKVAQLRAAIASGAYAINLGAVADAMMRFGGGRARVTPDVFARLIVQQTELIAALDAGDPDAILAASASLADAVEAVRSGVTAGREHLDHGLKLADAARIRVNYPVSVEPSED